MSLDVAVLYRWPSGACIVRPLTIEVHRWMAGEIISHEPEFWAQWGWQMPNGLIWSMLNEKGVCTSTVLANYRGQKITGFSISGDNQNRRGDLPRWRRFLVDLLGEQDLADINTGNLARLLDSDHGLIVCPGEFPVNFELYRLLGIDPMVWETDRFEPWWRELQAEGVVP